MGVTQGNAVIGGRMAERERSEYLARAYRDECNADATDNPDGFVTWYTALIERLLHHHEHAEVSDRSLLLQVHHTVLQLQQGIDTMATQAELDAAVAALTGAFDAGFNALETAISTETAVILAALPPAGGPVSQASVDAITAAAANIAAKLAQAQTDIANELPAAAPAPTG